MAGEEGAPEVWSHLRRVPRKTFGGGPGRSGCRSFRRRSQHLAALGGRGAAAVLLAVRAACARRRAQAHPRQRQAQAAGPRSAGPLRAGRGAQAFLPPLRVPKLRGGGDRRARRHGSAKALHGRGDRPVAGAVGTVRAERGRGASARRRPEPARIRGARVALAGALGGADRARRAVRLAGTARVRGPAGRGPAGGPDAVRMGAARPSRGTARASGLRRGVPCSLMSICP